VLVRSPDLLAVGAVLHNVVVPAAPVVPDDEDHGVVPRGLLPEGAGRLYALSLAHGVDDGAAPMKIVLEEIGVRGDDVLRELRVVAHSPKIRLRPVWAIANVCDSIGGGPDVAEVICVILPGEASGRKQVH